MIYRFASPLWPGSLLACLVLSAVVPVAAQQTEDGTPPWQSPDQLLGGYMPKEDLGVLEFMAQYPEADGRGIVVAVLDTGVDLLHPGLQRTSMGLPKIADVFDATDAGLVRTDTEVEVDSGEVLGLTGRTLTLGANGGEGKTVWLGRIRATSFFPEKLVERLLEDRRKAREDSEKVEADRKFGEDSADNGQAAARELGPVYDVVVFRQGDRFACAIDTDEDGDLAEESTLFDYRDSFSIAKFTDELNFAMAANIASDGKEVSFFFDGGGHGTHVAGIIGAYHGDSNPLNGLAPGVQIMAIKVGNNRLGGSTSHMSIIRALDYAARHGARIANASFGGGSFFQNGQEETIRFAEKLIDETGLLCTFSAGNAGPALSTVGSPALGERIFSIGATVSPTTQASNYGVLDPRRTQLFNFSSRGPLYSGGAGVDFLAPGVALSTVPTWFLSSGDSWNGTSMAAPQAAGALAVLLSAAKAEEVATPYRKVRRALEQSSRRLPHLLHVEQGYGLLQVPQAYRELQALSTRQDPLLWKIEVTNDTGRGTGLYDRGVTTATPFRRTFFITPELPEGTTNEVKTDLAYNLRLEDVPEWVRVVPLLHVTARGEKLDLEIDPARMSIGLNAAEIRAVDQATGEEQLRLSLVLIRPERVVAPDYKASFTWELEPGDRVSTFLLVPEGATRARMAVTEVGALANTYSLALSQASPWSGMDEASSQLSLERGAAERLDLAVEGGTTLEVVAYSRWHANVAGALQLEVSFDGFTSSSQDIEVPAGSGGASWKLHAALGAGSGEVKTSIDGARVPLAMEWQLARDLAYERVGKDGTMFVASGKATLRALGKEQLIVDMRAGDEFDDFLDDSFWCIRDPAGVEIGHGFLHEGRAEVTAPARGDFTFEATVVTYGRSFAGAGLGRIIAPERVRPFDGEKPGVFAGVYSGVPGEDALEDVPLGAGERDNLYVRIPDWPAGSLYRGSLEIREKDASTPLVRTAFHYDARRPLTPGQLHQAAVDLLREDLEQAYWVGSGAAAKEAARRLGEIGAPLDATREAELQVLTGDEAERAAGMTAVAALLAEETAKSAPDRAQLGRLHGLVALGSFLGDDHAAAGAAAKAALEAEAPPLLALHAKHFAAVAGGTPKDSVTTARALVEACPYYARATRWLVDAALDAGFTREAREAAETCLDRLPKETELSAVLLRLTELH